MLFYYYIGKMGEGFFFCVRVCRVGASRCRCVGKWLWVRGTNLGAEGRMREEETWLRD